MNLYFKNIMVNTKKKNLRLFKKTKGTQRKY